MFGSILSRMIFWSLVKVFLLCLVAITGILLMAGIVAEASQQGLNPGQILAIIPLLIPSTLPYTIPATTLFATCVVYGRMAADNEILAIRGSGVNLIRVVGPAVLLGALVSAGTLGLYYRIIPYTHHLMRTMFLADVEELLYTMLKKTGQLSYPGFDYSIFVKSVQGRRLLGPVFKHHDFNGNTDSSATAEEAELHVDMPTKTLLVRMHIVAAWSKNQISYDGVRDWTIDLPPDLVKNHIDRPRDMTWEQLDANLTRMRQAQEAYERNLEWAKDVAKSNEPGVREDMPDHVKNLQRRIGLCRRQILDIITEQHMRPALSLGCMFFVLVGCPVGIWFGRSDYLSSFISCFLPIIFIYYPLMLCGTGMAKDGRFDTMLTVWIADIVVGAFGVVFLIRLIRS